MARLGYIGLGKMGGRVAKRLVDFGHTVTGYNRTKSKAQWLLDAGMQWGETPRQVVEQSDVVFSMVTNTAALHEVLHGDSGILAALTPGKVYIDMSTVNASASREIAAQVTAKGAHMLDAPVSGNVLHVEEGTISMMVGGEKAAFESVLPILHDITPRVTYVGGNGQAIVMKIAINLSLSTQFLGFCEGILLAEKNGIPRATAVEAWRNSALASPATWHRAPFILEKPEEIWFDVNMMQKDLLLALELGRTSDVPLPSVALSNELLTAARAMGMAKEDFAVMFNVLARMAGVED
jgi:3-hydroxyisobutyrate dehydrogenase-like beta-hydroxyacid dehydrogenase